jgi:hypothetical protein
VSEGGFLSRSTSAPTSETVLTPELIDQMVKSIEDSFGYPYQEPVYLTSREELVKIMSSPAPYYKTMRMLLGIKLEIDNV